MPVGYAPAYTSTRGTVTVPNATVSGGGLRAGAAVAMVNAGTGPSIVECGSKFHGDRFFGFASVTAADGVNVAVVTTRGSVVTPIVEGGGSLTPNGRVYLSGTPGEVTQTPPALTTPSVFIQVGIATTTTTMILITDARHGISG
jgi:hypothetical protein